MIRRASGIRVAIVGTVTVLMTMAWIASGAAEPAPVDSLDLYLDGLSVEGDADFGLEALSISDAEVDSLIRVWEESGESPYTPAEPKWRGGLEIGAMRHNRVEGVNVMPGVRVSAPTSRPLSAHGRSGYGWSNREVTWRGGASARLLDRWGAPTLEVMHARDVLAYGSGGAPGNSITSALFGQDHGDYFLGEGWAVALGFGPGRFRIDLGWRDEDQESLANATEWALFEREDPFRPNPAVDPGDFRTAKIGVAWGDLGFGRFGARVRGTKGGGGLGGDSDWESIEARIVGRKGLWLGDLATVEFRGGMVAGDVPFQALHHLGGTATLRGYDINEIAAREFIHGRLDYRMGTNLLGYLPWLRGLRIQLVPFFDAAAVFEEQTREGVPAPLDDPRIESAAGLGFQHNLLGVPGGAGQIRLDAARRLDRGDDNITWRLMMTMQR